MAESATDVIEGFLCPMCMQNLRTQAQLLAHFQEKHEDEQDVLKSFKDLLGKAKKKIGLSQDEDNGESVFRSSMSTLKHQDSSFAGEVQELGAVRSHTERLKLFRNAKVEQYCTETNKLLIRLDKLLIDVPSDPAKRKAHEQNVVCWVEGTYVKLCPNCARNFHVARRKHHCRLCGAIMCHDCSHFLSINDAKRMIAATSIEEQASGVKRTGSTQSLNSVSSEADFRLCEPCHQRLSQREQLKEARMSRPIITQFYDKLQSHRNEALVILAEYHKLCFSLCSGESLYHLSDAQYLRVKLIKLAEALDNTSKAILVLGTKGGQASIPQGRAMRLQQAIRSSATIFLRDQLVGLPSLPSEAQLKVLQEKHQRAIESRLRSTATANAVASSRPPEVMASAGWTPESSSKLLLDSDNVMVQQMNILKNYIKQAREAHKFDVVATLEANLKELQEEYWRQQNQE